MEFPSGSHTPILKNQERFRRRHEESRLFPVGDFPLSKFSIALKTLKMLMGNGLRLTRVEVSFEILGALALIRFMSGLFYGVRASDPRLIRPDPAPVNSNRCTPPNTNTAIRAIPEIAGPPGTLSICSPGRHGRWTP